MADERYILEIYEPDSDEDVRASFSSDAPFMAVHAGDLINDQMTRDGGKAGGSALIVTHVEHFVWNSPDGPRHKLAIYTKQEQPPAGFRIRSA